MDRHRTGGSPQGGGQGAAARPPTMRAVHLCLYVTAAGHELPARRRDDVEHSRWAVADVDPLQALADHEAGAPPPTRPCSPEAFDEAIKRQGYRRAGGWLAGVGGPSCAVEMSPKEAATPAL